MIPNDLNDTIRSIARCFTVENHYIPTSRHDQAYRIIADRCRPSATEILDWLAPSWFVRFKGDTSAAFDYYPIADVERAEEEVWKLNKSAFIKEQQT